MVWKKRMESSPFTGMDPAEIRTDLLFWKMERGAARDDEKELVEQMIMREEKLRPFRRYIEATGE
jgi:hypothetical protein